MSFKLDDKKSAIKERLKKKANLSEARNRVNQNKY